MSNIDQLKRELELEEGKREGAYRDTGGKWHIGIGHLLNEQTDAELEILGLEDDLEDYTGFVISEEQIYRLLDHDIEETMVSVKRAFDQELLDSLDPKRFMAIFQMAYQIGSVTGFPAFCRAVREGRWEDAANEMLWRDGTKKAIRSRWYQQTPGRCQKMADLMRDGSVETEAVVTPEPVTFDLSTVSDVDLIAEISRRWG